VSSFHIRSTLAGELLPSRFHAIGEGSGSELCLLGPHGAGVVPMHRKESVEPEGAPAARAKEACDLADPGRVLSALTRAYPRSREMCVAR